MILAQLSDLHVCTPGTLAYGRVDTRAFLERAVARLNALRPRVEAVVVSGDLVDHGTREEYVALRPLLERLEMRWWPISGNHDGDAFWDVFADRLPGAERDVGYVVEHDGLPIALLDTRVAGAAHGELDDARVAWLTARFADTASAPRLLVLHHPPFDTGIAHMDRNGLRGRERLAGAFGAHPPLAILCGHVHRTIVGRAGEVPAIVAPSPAHAVAFDLAADGPADFRMDPPAVLVHVVTAGTLVSHTVFVDEGDGPHPFFP